MAEEEQKKPKKPDEDPVGKIYDSRLMRRLGHYLRPYWVQAAISTVAISIKSLCDVAGPYLIMVGIDRYFHISGESHAQDLLARGLGINNALTRRLSPDPATGITQLAEIYLAVLLAAYLFQFIQTYLMQWTGQKLMFDLRRDIFRH
ncbi:MAG: ABC transporter transmembrane domain-containing protein, partial [Terracidiphilus sp.]